MQVPRSDDVSPVERMRHLAALAGLTLLGALAVTPGVRTTTGITTAQATAVAAVAPAWTTYHLDNTRAANDTTEPSASGVSTAWTTATLDGQLYATPLLLGGAVYVATENDTIYALNTSTGGELWHSHVATPESAGNLPCGNVSPNVGITGTPVIDVNGDGGNGVIFAVAMTYEPHYRLYGVDLVTHLVVFNSIIDAGDILIEGQRGALALASGNVYVPFGGRAGDCYDGSTPYYGIVERIPTNGAAHTSWHPANTEASGIWAPGGESVDVSGNVYVATGNGIGPGSESVFKLTPTLGVLGQWRPSNAQTLDATDQDVGSISPGLIGGGNVFQNGKFGHGFVLGPALAQVTLDPGATTCGGVTSDASFGATAYAAPYIYVPCTNGLFAFDETTFSASSNPAWHALSSFSGPPIVAGGLVWALSSGTLYGFNATTGATVTSISVGSFSRFESPIAGGGKLFVAGSTYLEAFNILTGCSSASVTANPATTQTAGLGVGFNATASGANCGTPIFEYWIQYPDGVWHMVRAFSTDSTFNWSTAGLRPGQYVVHVWANEQGDQTATFEAYGSLTYTLTGCATAGLSAAPPSPSPRGGQIVFTGSSTGCPNPVYEFWLQYPNATWVMVQPFGPLTTWTWNDAKYPTGTYTVHVWANQTGSDLSTWQAFGELIYMLTVPPKCATAAVAPPAVSADAGTTVSLTGSSTGCPNPLYEWWVQYPNSVWYLKQGFGGSSFDFSTASLAPGAYTVHVWANQTSDSLASWEAYGTSVVTLTGCTSASLSPPSGSSTVGTPVMFNATSSGCATPVYEFWLQYPDGTWHLMQGFSNGSATWNWNTNGFPKGNYVVHVWANSQASDYSTWQTYGSATYTLT
ncbi:MAG TPA: PQQ-binding-like beta-propeller repeat protein [Candidatus Dormibacteraeota bacterium]|nr:PQQ-binding-like beta-propeller repeat protein [Candidatus Dormibacteraeota bacterium]